MNRWICFKHIFSFEHFSQWFLIWIPFITYWIKQLSLYLMSWPKSHCLHKYFTVSMQQKHDCQSHVCICRLYTIKNGLFFLLLLFSEGIGACICPSGFLLFLFLFFFSIKKVLTSSLGVRCWKHGSEPSYYIYKIHKRIRKHCSLYLFPAVFLWKKLFWDFHYPDR